MPHYERFKHRPRERLSSHGVHEHFPRGRTYFGRAGAKNKAGNGTLIRNIVIIALVVGVIYLVKNGGRDMFAKFMPKPAESAKSEEKPVDPKARKLEDALKKFLTDVQTPPSRELTVVTKSDEKDAGVREVIGREKDTDAEKVEKTVPVREMPERTVAKKTVERAKTDTRTVKPEAKEMLTAVKKKNEKKADTLASVEKEAVEKPVKPAKKKVEVAAAHADEAPKAAAKPAIYFIKYDEEKGNIELAPRKRPLGYKPTVKDAITALLDGPDNRERDGNIITCVPEKAYLIDAKQDGDTVYLDFNSEFEFNRLGYEGLRAQVHQIVYTATQFPGIKSVVFLINGKRRDSIGGEGFSIAKPFTRSGAAMAVN